MLASRKPQQYPHLFPVPYPEFLPGDTDNPRVITPGPGSVPAEHRRIRVKLLSDQKMVLANTLPKLCLRKSLVRKRPFFHLPGPLRLVTRCCSPGTSTRAHIRLRDPYHFLRTALRGGFRANSNPFPSERAPCCQGARPVFTAVNSGGNSGLWLCPPRLPVGWASPLLSLSFLLCKVGDRDRDTPIGVVVEIPGDQARKVRCSVPGITCCTLITKQ